MCISSTFCIVDNFNECIAVTVYNLANGQGVIIGDIVAIAMPYLKEIDFVFKNKVIMNNFLFVWILIKCLSIIIILYLQKFHFKSIRVSNPLLLAVNGKPFPSGKMSSMQMSTFSEADSKKQIKKQDS